MADWAGILKIGMDLYSGYKAGKESERVSKEASKPRSGMTTRTPYGNEWISALVPYLLENQQNIFAHRMREYGAQPADFTQYAQILSGVPRGYSGVGAPGAPVMTGNPVAAGMRAGTAAPMAAPQAPAQPVAAPQAAAQPASPAPQMERYWEQTALT